MEFLVAELIEGSLALRHWTFDQRGKAQLELAGEPQVLIRFAPGAADDAPRLTALRRCIAAPGSIVTRPLGLAPADPRAAAEELHAAARLAGTGHVPTDAGVKAIADVFRGCDDDLAFTPGRLAQVVRELGESAWAVEHVEQEGERRATMTSGAGSSRQTLTWLRKSEGWVVTEIAATTPQP